MSCAAGRTGSFLPCPACSRASNCCSHMVRRVATAGSVFERVWGAGSLERIEQHPAIGSDLIGVLRALLLLQGLAFFFKTLSIAFHPLNGDVSANPGRSDF
jgi:hypothetical protein